MRASQKYRLANMVFFFISGFGYSSWASRIPSIKQQLHLNNAQLGAVLFALPVGLMVTMPFTGKLLSRYSSKHIMLAGAILFNIAGALPGFAAFTWQLVIILGLFGAARNMFNISINAQALSVQALYDRSIVTTFHAVWSTAGFAGAALGYAMVYYNIAPSYHLLGVSVIMLALTTYFYPHSLEPEPSKEKKKFFSLPDRSLLTFSLICFVAMACENTMYDWSGIYFQTELHTTKSMATSAYVLFMMAVTISRFFGDRAVTKFGIKQILFYSAFFIITGFSTCFVFRNLYANCMGYLLIGTGVSCIVPLVFSLAGKSITHSSGPALASISTVGYLGFLIVPPMVGFISQISNLKWAFLIMALLGVMMLWMVSKLDDRK